MELLRNYPLKNHNTFGFDVSAQKYGLINSETELREALKNLYADELFILGGGSNILLTRDLNCTVLQINFKGISIVEESPEYVIIRAKAGENWHQFVRYCVEQNFGGIENLSLIPGNVGTTPIQNIGAYGIELQDTFIECKAIHRKTLETRTFKKEECKFGYRDSIFKNELKDQYVITDVLLKLSKKHHQIHAQYGSLHKELAQAGIENPTIKDVSDAVIKIRRSKLPDPKNIGNSGSFFKNPIVSKGKFEVLKKKFPEIHFYKINRGTYKIPAGWLIDHAELKGYRTGDAGVHKKQALVLVNYGKATGEEVYQLAKKVQQKILDKYDIELEMEVNVI